ncbi:hypothetical protein ABT126_45670 [Streptomyces sp. NPDC002012]|uniref:hypothetical protein n=1 Tax=Streptomyces sp. NPDC002012 TaxID=3154532 RepID=UPI00332F104C
MMSQARTNPANSTVGKDSDLVVFLEAAGIADPEAILDDPQWVEWRGGHAHEFSAACECGVWWRWVVVSGFEVRDSWWLRFCPGFCCCHEVTKLLLLSG